MLRRLLKRLTVDVATRGESSGASTAKLLSGEVVVERWRSRGETKEAALALTVAQVRALEGLVRDDPGWTRLQTLVGRAGDPWNAFDWPAGFDPLILCAPLCQRVAFECRQCPVGQVQGRSCSDPVTDIGSILGLIGRAERAALLVHLDRLRAHLTAMTP
ncbi:MAG: hypothetical protein JKY37_05995 [Nannocystaceae bacterium]|nr:hypothetical protein [Nannocystaceae bacterium]